MTRIISPPSLTGYSKTTQDRALDRMLDDIDALPARPKYGIDAAGLLAVAKATREAKREEFNMGLWCANLSCGTKACAVGHFTLAHPNDDLHIGPCERNVTTRLYSAPELSGFEAIAARFGISHSDAVALFDAESYATYDEDGSYTGVGREEVAERIEKFIATCEGVEL